jgi:rod shape-determining protein MreD
MDRRRPGIRLRPSLWRRLDAAARRGFPGTCAIALMLLTATPLGLAEQATLMPAVAFACVFFWSLFRPASMSPAMVFCIGLVLDLQSYLPLGVGVLTLLAVHAVTAQARRALAQQGFLLVWFAFLLIAAAASLLEWLLICGLTLQLLPFAPALFQVTVTASLYPVLAMLLSRAHRTVADPEHA